MGDFQPGFLNSKHWKDINAVKFNATCNKMQDTILPLNLSLNYCSKSIILKFANELKRFNKIASMIYT